LTGMLEPDNGSIRLGKNLELEKLDQERHSLNPTDTLATALTGGGDKVTINGETRHVIGYMKDFLFTANQAQTPVNVLSGGERGRIMQNMRLPGMDQTRCYVFGAKLWKEETDDAL
ncbi:MAG: hypothetical protein QGH12_00355, partial [SAR324 cluster bacterium]|nr:hypothetical protein [SAR324 cluster bacterium]